MEHSGGKETETKDVPRPGSGAKVNNTVDTDASGDEDDEEETNSPLRLGHQDDDEKKQGRKKNGGTLPKTTEQASHSNQSTPKTARKQTLMQDSLLG